MSFTQIGAAGEDNGDFKSSQGGGEQGSGGLTPIWRPDAGARLRGFKIPTVHNVIVQGQLTSEEWPYKDVLKRLNNWQIRFINKLDIRVHASVRLRPSLVSIEPMNIKTVGRYESEHNGLAIEGVIHINQKLLEPVTPFAFTLAYLLKFLLQARDYESQGRDEVPVDWQPDDSGGDWKGRELKARQDWRARMREAGVVIDKAGTVRIDPDGSFASLLTPYHYFKPAQVVIPRPACESRSSLKPWSCRCGKVHIGRDSPNLQCLNCGEKLVMVAK